MPVKKIPSSDVTLGMYISSLDRPWTETPFLFQGFVARTQQELNDLRRLTRHVYVAVPDEEIELHELPTSHTSLLPPPQVRYQTHAIDGVMKGATPSHAQLSELVTEIGELAGGNPLLKLQDIQNATAVMTESIIGNPDAYVWLTSIRKFDSYLYKDALTVSVWATALGRELGLPAEQLKKLATGTLLMDIGKTSLPHQLLHKEGRLTHDDWEAMKAHVDKGLYLLEYNGEDDPDVLAIVRSHHERLDGSGYPQGLVGRQIPLLGMIAGIVDFYVAVTNPRPYAKPIAPALALQMLYEQKEKYFDADLVEAFIRVLGTYPTGSLVELSSGEIGLVCSQDPHYHLKPNVVLLAGPDKQLYEAFPLASLATYRYGPAKEPVRIVKSIPDGSYGLHIDNIHL